MSRVGLVIYETHPHTHYGICYIDMLHRKGVRMEWRHDYLKAFGSKLKYPR